MWNLRTLAEPTQTAQHLPVESVTISGDVRRAFAISTDGTSNVWHLDEGRSNEEVTVAVPDVDVSALTAIFDRIEALERQEAPGAAAHEVLAVAVSADRERAVCATQRWTVLSGHHRWAADTSRVRVWDLGPEPVAQVLVKRSQNVVGFQQTEQHRDVAITPDGRYGVGVGDDRTVTVWDLEMASPIASFTADSAPHTCAISPDGQTIAAVGDAGDVHLLRMTALR